MTVRQIRLVGDPVLRTPCDPVTRFDGALARLVTDLVDTVQQPYRAGLAANQIGVSLAVFSYNVDGQLGYVVNPVLAGASGEQDGPEGCLSIPGISADRHRAARVTVTGVNANGKPLTVSGYGELAPLPAARDRPSARRVVHRRARRRRTRQGAARDPPSAAPLASAVAGNCRGTGAGLPPRRSTRFPG